MLLAAVFPYNCTFRRQLCLVSPAASRYNFASFASVRVVVCGGCCALLRGFGTVVSMDNSSSVQDIQPSVFEVEKPVSAGHMDFLKDFEPGHWIFSHC